MPLDKEKHARGTTQVLDSKEPFPSFEPQYATDGLGNAGSKAQVIPGPGPDPWYRVAWVPLKTTKEHFDSVMHTWIHQPELTVPPVLRAEILEEDKEMGIVRRLVPRRPDKDRVLVEHIQRIMLNGATGMGVTFQPIPEQSGGMDTGYDTADDLPFYYPKVRAYGYFYDPKDEVLSIHVVPLNQGITSSGARDKMEQVWARLLHTLFKWLCNAARGYRKRVHHDQLVDKETYQACYQGYRERHAKRWLRDWTESTDPRKFIFEDLGIAAWLACLWREEIEDSSKQEMDSEGKGKESIFVDLGCGNGLLVQILATEGHRGWGVDMTRRRIWEAYDAPVVDIREEALDPPNLTYPPGSVDWIIGNHADELIPWIPIIAARSGYHTKFVLIPCCFYNLVGSKAWNPSRELHRNGKEEGEGKRGRLAGYITYLEGIMEACGYVVERESLRIPTTRNLALVGRKRTFAPDDKEEEGRVRKRVLNLVKQHGPSFTLRVSDRDKEEQRRMKREARMGKGNDEA